MNAAADLSQAVSYLPSAERKTVEKALQKAEEWHGGQVRDSGEPYVTHPIAVACFLASLEADRDTIIAALFHDTVEDDRTTPEEISSLFGPDVAKLVDGVTKLSKLNFEGRRAERQIATLRKLLLTGSEDIRVIFIKLADRWHNIVTLGGLPEDRRARMALETLDIFVPFARLVGLGELKSVFETICFPLAYPEQYKVWHEAIDLARGTIEAERSEFIRHLNAEIETPIESRLDPMTDYEIFTECHGVLENLRNPGTVDMVQILLTGADAKPADCYRVLGDIHLRYIVRSGFFKDYINTPRPNGYCALHTTILLSRDLQVRIRIQTQAMHEHVFRRKLSSWIHEGKSDVYSALQSVQGNNEDLQTYMSDLRRNVLNQRMHVFTPQGEIITLGLGATGIDFAFRVDPDTLANLIAVRINGIQHEPTHALKEGDIVELVLLEQGQENPNGSRPRWMEKATSPEARQALRDSMQRDPRETQISEGQSILEIECHKRGLPVRWLLHVPTMQKRISRDFGRETFDDVLQGIGSGEIPVGAVVEACSKYLTTKPDIMVRTLQFFHLLPRSRILNKRSHVIDLEVHAQDRKGLLYEVTRCFAERDINIARFDVYAIPNGGALYSARVEVERFEDFSDVFDALLGVPGVAKVLRTS